MAAAICVAPSVDVAPVAAANAFAVSRDRDAAAVAAGVAVALALAASLPLVVALAASLPSVVSRRRRELRRGATSLSADSDAVSTSIASRTASNGTLRSGAQLRSGRRSTGRRIRRGSAASS